jgi:hypothetical protein
VPCPSWHGVWTINAERQLGRRKIHSWLNIAEIELSVFNCQCLDRRIGDEATLKREIRNLKEARNAACAKIEWRFTTEDARDNLRRLYPSTSD